jgi:hypothetical protein
MNEPEQEQVSTAALDQDAQAQPDPTEDDGDDTWWKTALYALGMWAATGYFYYFITSFEAGSSARTRIWWPVALIYNTLGKWPVVGIGVVLGLVLAAMAVSEWRKSTRQ